MLTRGYRHTQKGTIHLVLIGLGVALALAGASGAIAVPVGPILLVVAVIFVVIGFSFRELTIEDGGDGLAIRFGPLPFFRERVSYDSMTDVEQGTTSLIDGIGIHRIPGHGWIYNIRGRSCVIVHRRADPDVRLGTDDAPALARFLEQKLAERGRIVGGARPSGSGRSNAPA